MPVSITATFDGTDFRALPTFVEAYPDIVVEVLIEQAFTNIVERRLDAGIRLGESLEKDVVAVPVSGPLRMAVIASPAYLKRHGVPKTPRDLRSHRCINLRLASAGTLYKWEFERGAEKMDIAVDGPDAGGRRARLRPGRPGARRLQVGRARAPPRGLVPALSRLLSLLPGQASAIPGARRVHRGAPRAKPPEKAPLTIDKDSARHADRPPVSG